MADFSSSHGLLHEKAVRIAGQYLRFEAELIGVLQELDRTKTFLHYKQPSLFAYATKCMKLSDTTSLTLIGIARKSVQCPLLKAAIENKQIDLSKARRIAPILNLENQTQWIDKAASLSLRELERELAAAFPERASPSKIKYKSESLARLETDVSHKAMHLLKRAQELLSQKKQAHVDISKTLEAVLEEFVERHDPVQRAKRAEARASRGRSGDIKRQARAVGHLSIVELDALVADEWLGHHSSDQAQLVAQRVPFDAAIKHQLVLRDGHQCMHFEEDGTRCAEKKWLDIHHILPVRYGGTNALSNLRMLCGMHHRMKHAA